MQSSTRFWGAVRQAILQWPAPADDGAAGDPLDGAYRVQYTSVSAEAADPLFWSTASAQVALSTSGVAPGTVVSTTVARLSLGVTYYFRLAAVDDVGRWSAFSSTATLFLPEIIMMLTTLVTTTSLNFGSGRISRVKSLFFLDMRFITSCLVQTI